MEVCTNTVTVPWSVALLECWVERVMKALSCDISLRYGSSTVWCDPRSCPHKQTYMSASSSIFVFALLHHTPVLRIIIMPAIFVSGEKARHFADPPHGEPKQK